VVVVDRRGPTRGGQLGQGRDPALLQDVEEARFEFGSDVTVGVLDLVGDAVAEPAGLRVWVPRTVGAGVSCQPCKPWVTQDRPL
jgi:hypothetical protein